VDERLGSPALLISRATLFLSFGGIMILFLLTLFACGEDDGDSGTADTAASIENTEDVSANFYCG